MAQKDGNLVNFEANRWLPDHFVCDIGMISYDLTVSETNLFRSSVSLAIGAMAHIYGRFNWDGPERPILIQDQKRFMDRRL